MKTVLSILCIFALSLNSCFIKNGERGDGNIQSKEFTVDDYFAVSLSGPIKMFYEQKITDKPYLRIEIDENLLEYLEPEVKNGCLNLGTRKNINPTKYVIYTNSTSMRKAVLSGSSNLSLGSDIETDELDISISGSGKVYADNVNCRDSKIAVS